MFYIAEWRLCVGQSSSTAPNLLMQVFIDLALCSGVQEGATPKLFQRSWEHEIVQNVSFCWSIKSSFLWNYKHAWFVPPGNTSSLLYSPVLTCFTPLRSLLCSVLHDLTIVCSCMGFNGKLSTHSSRANLSLEVYSDWLYRALLTSGHHATQPSLTLLSDFMWLSTLCLSCHNTTNSWLWNI